MALRRPVPQIDQFTSLAAEGPPGVVIKPGQGFALWAGVGACGLVSHVNQLTVDSGQLTAKEAKTVWIVSWRQAFIR